MAISAYRQGKLKKNPLLGSSLAVDPNRAQERKDFMSLYGEAKEVAGEGRAGMVRRLSERYQKFGAPHVKQMEGFGAERDKLAAVDTSKERMGARRELASADAGVAAGKQWLSKAGLKKFDAYSPSQQQVLEDARVKQYGEKGKQFQWRRKLAHGKKYYNELAAKKKEAYEGLVTENTARVARIGTLTGQYNEQRGMLQARADQYNRFLGI